MHGKQKEYNIMFEAKSMMDAYEMVLGFSNWHWIIEKIISYLYTQSIWVVYNENVNNQPVKY